MPRVVSNIHLVFSESLPSFWVLSGWVTYDSNESGVYKALSTELLAGADTMRPSSFTIAFWVLDHSALDQTAELIFIFFCWSTGGLPKALHSYYSFESTVTGYILLYADCTELQNSGSWTDFYSLKNHLQSVGTYWHSKLRSVDFPLL